MDYCEMATIVRASDERVTSPDNFAVRVRAAHRAERQGADPTAASRLAARLWRGGMAVMRAVRAATARDPQHPEAA